MRTTVATYTLVVVLLALPTEFSSLQNSMAGLTCLSIKTNRVQQFINIVLQQSDMDKYSCNISNSYCYPELGCFPNIYPWNSVERPVPPPFHPAQIDVQITCYSRQSVHGNKMTLWPNINLGDCLFSPERKSVFITHGYLENGSIFWLLDMKNEYLNMMDTNIFLVDWMMGATFSYPEAVSNARIAGAEIARFLVFLKTTHGLNANNVHLIGYCLGAHVMSYAAKTFPGIGLLTALDPAQPGFENEPVEVRVDKTDANIVEVVHTNADPFLGFGMVNPIGDVDFYINGGRLQPRCPYPKANSTFIDLTTVNKVLYNRVLCSHIRAIEYYIYVLEEDCMIWGQTISFPDVIHKTVNFYDDIVGLRRPIYIPLGPRMASYSARGVVEAYTIAYPPYCITTPAMNKIFELHSKSN